MRRLFIWAAMLLPVAAHSQGIEQKADELMKAYSDQQKFSGNVLIASKGKIVFEKSYGLADRQNNIANNSQTEFRAASLTKMFTAVLIMQLVEQKKLLLSDPVAKYLKGIDPSGKVTIRHLLSHTSGLKGSTEPGSSSLEEMIKGYKPADPSFAPGERFEYNNFNFIVLAWLAQKRTGIRYSELLQKRVLLKAGMTHSGIDEANRLSVHKAAGYVTDPSTNQWVLTGNDNTIGAASGAGALYTTTEDLFQWSKHIGSSKLLKKESWNRILTPVQPGYGLGWMLQQNQGRQKIGHTGSIPGFIADFAWFPKDSILITYLSNYQDLDGRKLEETLTALVYNEPYSLPKQRKEITLPVETLQEYVGVYEINEQVQIKVILEGTALMAIAPGGDKVELTAESKDHFFLKGPEIVVEFRRNEGKIESMFIDMQGGQLFRRK